MDPAVNSWARPARNITACVLIVQPTKSSSHHETRLLLSPFLSLLLPSQFILFYKQRKETPGTVSSAPSQQQHTSCNNLLFLPF